MPAPKQKVAALALAGIMAFGLTACDDSDDPGTDVTTDPGTDMTDVPITDAPLPEDESVFEDTTPPVDG